MRRVRDVARDPEGDQDPADAVLGALELDPLAAEALHSTTRLLAGIALYSLDVLDSAVTLPQFRLLAVLAELGRVPSGRAARTLGLDPSTITRLADRMVAAGHVARGTDERHRGVVTLELTASGRRLVTAADDWRRAELARIMARLRPEDQAAVTASLGLLLAAAGEEYGVATRRPVPLLYSGRRRHTTMTEIDVRPEELTARAVLFAAGHVADPCPAHARWRARRPVARPHVRAS